MSATPADVLTRFQQTFSELGPGKDMRLSELYAEDIVFEDPAHRIEGRDALANYFDRLNAGLRSGSFEFTRTTVGERSAALCWRMDMKLKLPKKRISVDGVSVIDFSELEGTITHQRDYFDLGQLLYEQMPILGFIVRAVRKKFAAN